MQGYALAASVGVSLVAVVAIVASRRMPNLREAWTLAAAIAKVVLIAALLPDVLAGGRPEITLLQLVPGADLTLRADPAGMLFALSAAVLWLVTSVYSIGYVRSLAEKNQTRYFACFAACLSATVGLAFAANLVTFFIFYELLTAATYPLVAHKQTAEAIRGGRVYLGYLLAGGVALLLAVVITHGLAPVDFAAGGYLGADVGQATMLALFALFAVGFGTKSAIMPLHAWLPTAMVAPTPVSALLHAVAVVKAGVFGFARAIGFVIGPETAWALGATGWLAALAAVTVVVASLVAFRQDNLKRRLAYSTVAHLSLIVVGLSILSVEGWSGGMLHIVNHAALKITLFFCAGAIYVRTHVEQISEMDGIGRQMPVTMACFGIASLGLAGIPPLGGFVSKVFLGIGAVEADAAVLAIVVIGSGLLTAGYLLPIFFRAFFRPSVRFTSFGEAPAMMVTPLAFTALLAVVLGLGDLLLVGELATLVGADVVGATR